MARILFLVHRIPYPPNKGDKIRSWHFLKHLAAKHDVHLGYYIDDKRDLAHVSVLEAQVTSQAYDVIEKKAQKLLAARGFLTGSSLSEAAYPTNRLRTYVNQLAQAGDIDLVFLFSGATYPLIQDLPADLPVVADLVDVDSEKWAAYATKATFPMSWVYRREAHLLSALEVTVATRASSTLFVSRDEAALFRKQLPDTVAATVTDVPNGVDTDHFNPERFAEVDRKADRLIFTGAMDYAPNIEAAEWFVANVWPSVTAATPEAEFVIAGGPSHPRVQALGEIPGVQVTGYVDDMAAEIAAAGIIVAPLLTARGIQNKVLEGMAMARPVVASPAAKEGIEAEAGTHLMVADGADAMASAIHALMDDQQKAQEIGAAARQQICTHYGWARAYEKLDDLVAQALEPTL